jgi:Peroxidase, family 2
MVASLEQFLVSDLTSSNYESYRNIYRSIRLLVDRDPSISRSLDPSAFLQISLRHCLENTSSIKMRPAIAILGALSFCISEVIAFPAAAIEFAAKAERDAATAAKIESAVAAHRANRRAPIFSASAQYVATSGQYAFVPPSNVNTETGDQRGPCPGLNAMANHNYLPHDGVATIQEFIDGTYEGMFDLASLPEYC